MSREFGDNLITVPKNGDPPWIERQVRQLYQARVDL